MPSQDALETVREESVQSRARGESNVGLSLLFYLAVGTNLIPPWWSRARDAELRRFWKKNDYLSGAMYTMISRMTTVPFRVYPYDMSIKTHVRQARDFEEMLRGESEFGEGWMTFYSKFVEDLIGCDNGGFGEVIGEGKPDGPIVGRPHGIAHLDSYLCTRTGDPEFPVVYGDPDGQRHKLHYTRVVYDSQMPSAESVMNGVGYCAISRCVNTAQNLLDIMIYKQEKLGSRPHRAILLTKGGLSPGDVKTALQIAESNMDDQGLTAFSKIALTGSSDIPEAALDMVDLASLPDGFEEQQSVTLGMAVISLAFGVDARELFPGLEAGATRAEALIAHIKQRGKGPGQILQSTEEWVRSKLLPPHLGFEFDFQDDEQDRTVAEIKGIRAERYERMIVTQALDLRTVREQMLDEGDITQAQFDRLELEDGRLPDGQDVLVLFHNPDFKPYLDLGVENPLDTAENKPADMLKAIEVKRSELMAQSGNSRPGERDMFEQAEAALRRLKLLYGGLSAQMVEKPKPPSTTPAPERLTPKPGESPEGKTGVMKPFSSEDLSLKSTSTEEAMVEAAQAIKAAADRIGINGKEDHDG